MHASLSLLLVQTRAVNPKAEIANTVTFAGTSPLIQLDFSTCDGVCDARACR